MRLSPEFSGSALDRSPESAPDPVWSTGSGSAAHSTGSVLSLTGRWPSRVPIEEQGGVKLYGFFGNGPVGRWDVLGMDGSGWLDDYRRRLIEGLKRAGGAMQKRLLDAFNPCCSGGEPIDCSMLRSQNDLLFRLFNDASNALRDDLQFQFDSELTLFGVDRAIYTVATIIGVGVGSSVNSARAASASQRVSESLGGQLVQGGTLTHGGSTLSGSVINTATRAGPGLVAGGATREALRRPPRWSTQGVRDDIQSNVDNLNGFVQDLADRLSNLKILIRQCCQAVSL